ncbi:uncharacterized protein HMPREF1541_09304 [Cyphellophora europaea CBS 101466]|uniref:RRM domain-containing protein n=1 Tax=Cyphellophora europaea (strain CBS 101466) TaxID=1220924 RepID=W2S9W5_CYPE1|nr:uncharacterized protein HMPREF1541_09304 [Cyphellophora europaea CBS 101466]ETN45472.1 hypothetical protein HMPREF1541_09304 [Cyphellophora europaea CBS 101466]
MSKRKRSQNDNPTSGTGDDGPRKTRVLDSAIDDSNKTHPQARAAARQAKSERRSKKKDKQQKEKPERSSHIPDATEELIPDQQPSTNADHFSSNNDFVSLNDQPSAASKPPKSPAVAASQVSKKSKVKASKVEPTQSEETRMEDTTTAPSKDTAHRFILFIGNLPYTTTTPSIDHHFRALQPFTVRHLTDRKTHKSRGTAFLEFTSYDRMKTCLKLYHHSLFDPDAHLHAPSTDTNGDEKQQSKSRSRAPTEIDESALPKQDTQPQWQKSRADKTRRINVELTAGGGGKGQDRRNKIQAKNAKLAEERERLHKREAEDRDKKRKDAPAPGVASGANAEGAEDRGNVHPSRMRRVPG